MSTRTITMTGNAIDPDGKMHKKGIVLNSPEDIPEDLLEKFLKMEVAEEVKDTPDAAEEEEVKEVTAEEEEEEEEPKEDVPDPLLAILDQNVAKVTAALKGLTDEDIHKLRQAEKDGNTRTTLIKAIDEELAARANAHKAVVIEAVEKLSAKSASEGKDYTFEDVNALLEPDAAITEEELAELLDELNAEDDNED